MMMLSYAARLGPNDWTYAQCSDALHESIQIKPLLAVVLERMRASGLRSSSDDLDEVYDALCSEEAREAVEFAADEGL